MIIPTGPAGDAMVRLAAMIAASATFQTATKAPDATAALEQVSYPRLRDGLAFTRPLAVIKLADDGVSHYRAEFGGAKTYFHLRGSLELLLGRPLVELDDSRDQEIDFLNYCEGIVGDLNEASGVNDNLNIVGMAMTMAPSRSDPRHVAGQTAEPPYYAAKFKIDWDQL